MATAAKQSTDQAAQPVAAYLFRAVTNLLQEAGQVIAVQEADVRRSRFHAGQVIAQRDGAECQIASLRAEIATAKRQAEEWHRQYVATIEDVGREKQISAALRERIAQQAQRIEELEKQLEAAQGPQL